MVARMGSLVDKETGKLRKDSVTKINDNSVRIVLTNPDITLIANLTEFPALVVHRSFDATGADFTNKPVGTGPFELVSYEVGARASFKRRENGRWWRGDAYLDGVEFIDYGTDPSAVTSAFEAGEVDTNYATSPDLVPILESPIGDQETPRL